MGRWKSGRSNLRLCGRGADGPVHALPVDGSTDAPLERSSNAEKFQ